MNDIDLNLLPALDALLQEGSVTGAARRLGLSASAMSRALARLRSMSGDPLLVRAGVRMVPTPRALAMRDRVREVARDARAVLSREMGEVNPATLERTFVVRANEGFFALFAGPLVATVVRVAPRVQLRFLPRVVKDALGLREGQVDLEIGVLGKSGPEVRMRALFRDRFVGVARAGHSVLSGQVTAESYAKCRHVVASRNLAAHGPVDDALAELGLRRPIAAVVASFPDALRIARESDVIAQVPRSMVRKDVPAAFVLSEGLEAFELPFPLPEIVVSAMWHPRFEADPAHRWLREMVINLLRDLALK